MPASEFMGWQAYFTIFPFTQDREDGRNAMLLAAIATVASGKPVGPEKFIPDYLGTRSVSKELSLEEQKAADIAFGNKLRAMKRGKRGT